MISVLFCDCSSAESDVSFCRLCSREEALRGRGAENEARGRAAEEGMKPPFEECTKVNSAMSFCVSAFVFYLLSSLSARDGENESFCVETERIDAGVEEGGVEWREDEEDESEEEIAGEEWLVES